MNERARDLILRTIDQWEGGLSNHPYDRGGLTKYGISKRSFPEVDIESLTKEEAVTIIFSAFYFPLNLQGIESIRLRWKTLDIGVNTAGWRAAKFLQNAVGVTPDGLIGPITLAAVNSADPDKVLFELIKKQARHYARIMAVDNRQAKNAIGWIRRAFDMAEELRTDNYSNTSKL